MVGTVLGAAWLALLAAAASRAAEAPAPGVVGTAPASGLAEAREADLVPPGDAAIAPFETQSATAEPGAPSEPRQPGNPASDPPLKPSPLQAQFWVAVAVIGAGFIASIGFL